MSWTQWRLNYVIDTINKHKSNVWGKRIKGLSWKTRRWWCQKDQKGIWFVNVVCGFVGVMITAAAWLSLNFLRLYQTESFMLLHMTWQKLRLNYYYNKHNKGAEGYISHFQRKYKMTTDEMITVGKFIIAGFYFGYKFEKELDVYKCKVFDQYRSIKACGRKSYIDVRSFARHLQNHHKIPNPKITKKFFHCDKCLHKYSSLKKWVETY